MANKSFTSRRMPQSSVQASNVNGMTEHLLNADPHPQYLKVSQYTGGSGEVSLDDYVVKTVYNAHVAAFEGWQTTINTWKSGIDTWKTTTVTPALTTIETFNNRISANEVFRSDHTAQYAQSYNGVLPAHKDSDGQELYARRIHTHVLSDFNAAAADHNHDNDYLRINDLYNQRTSPAGITVPALSDMFAPFVHGHSEYVNYSDLEARGVYPSAHNPFESNVDEVITEVDLNDLLDQGIYNIHPSSGQTLLNTPSNAGMLIVVEDVTVEGENSRDDNGVITITTAGKHVTHQVLIADTGIVRQRRIETTDAVVYAWTYSSTEEEATIYTNTATGAANLNVYESSVLSAAIGKTTTGDTESITFNGIVYARDTIRDTVGSAITPYPWYIISAPTRTKANTNSGTAYAMNTSSADIHNITLTGDCTLTVTNINPGQTAYLYVTTNGTYTLTFNGVTLLSTEDSGLFRIEFQNPTPSGTTAKCIGIAAILA